MLIWLLLLVLIGLVGGLAWFIHRIRRCGFYKVVVKKR